MSPSQPFIVRPVATSLLMTGLLLVGIAALRQLPVSALPQVDYPTIEIQTFYPGASPDVTASYITAPLEKQFGQLAGLNQMTSSSSEGCSVITLQFVLNLNIDVAEQEVQQAINNAGSFLPADLPNPPIYSKTNPADTPILTLALTSKTLPLYQVEDLADTRLAQKIAQVSGVGLVTISGGQKPAVRIQANPTALSALGMTMEDLRTAITSTNVNEAKGSFNGNSTASTIEANDQLLRSADYKPLVLRYNGSPVKLSDVADVVDDAENVKQRAWMNDQEAVIVNIQRQPGANIIAVVNNIERILPQLKSTLPASIDIYTLTDRTVTIAASVADVEFELCLTVALVVMVMFVFLRNISATIIPSVAVPLSIVGTFAVMYLLGYSLNNLSLMALTISTGFVVDDAIVMIENIIRYLEEGDSPLQAALKGSEQIGFTIISLSVSLIAALIPLLFMPDIVGRLFREFAVTLSVTIVVSAIVSLTLTPMMCAHLLRHKAASEQGWFYRISEKGFNAIIAFYGKTLQFVLRHQPATLLVAVATLALTVALFIIIPKGFFPVQDTGVILGISEARQDVSFQRLSELQQQLTKVILKDKNVESLSSFIGVDGTNVTPNSGRIQINLKPLEKRKISAEDVVRELNEKLSNRVSDIVLYMQPVQDLTVEDRVSRTQYQYTLEDPNADELAQWAPQFVAKLQAESQLRDVATDQQNNGRRSLLQIDRDTASRLGITPQMIDATLYDSFGQRQISTMFTQLNQYHVVLEVKPQFRQNPQSLKSVYVRSASGGEVALSEFCQIIQQPAPLAINHQGQFAVVTVSFNLAPGASLGDAVSAINKASNDLGVPPAMTAGFQGTAAAFQNSLSNETYLVLAALVVVYIVLGVLYESFIHPITILSTLPSAGVGALLALIICRNDFSVIALIGIILLIGIVKKNAIMMIDFALEAERKEGKPPLEAIYQACLLRFRPITMTTAAALLGGLPLALGTGVGSELRRPLGIAIVGGLIFSQMLTLYTTPVIYLAFDKLARFVSGRRQAPTLNGGVVETT